MGINPANDSSNNLGMVAAARPDPSKTQPKSQGRFSQIKLLALICHVKLQEVFETFPSPSAERAKTCFKILEDIKENFGAYSSVVSIIISELKSAVYSDAMTSSLLEPYFEYIPYCAMLKRFEAIKLPQFLTL